MPFDVRYGVAYYSNNMSLNCFVHINPPQTLVNRLYNPVLYAICIHWQLHVFDANRKMLVIPFNEPLGSHIENYIEIDVKSSSGHPIAQGRSGKHPTSGIFRFPVEPGGEYYLWVRHYVNGVVTYAKDGKLTAAVHNYNSQVILHSNVIKGSLLPATHMMTLNHQVLFIILLGLLLY